LKYLLLKLLVVFNSLFFIHAHAEDINMSNTKPMIMVVETTQGTFEVTLKPTVAPKASENFAHLAESGYYNGIIFHRIIKDFMIQGGDPTGTGTGGQSMWNKSFEDECSPLVRFDKPGLLAMANRGPNTNGSQFFITTAAAPWLNGKHTIFGEVTSGYDVVQKMNVTKTGPNDRPVELQKIVKIYLKK
jgi:peptidylprolyl isomerase